MFTNIACYVVQWVLRAIGTANLPSAMPAAVAEFVYFRPAVKAFRLSVGLRAFNTFLNWVKLYGFMAHAPRFAVLIDTIVKAAGPVGNFAVGFLLVFFGFAQAHAMVFGHTTMAFRTIPDSLLSLVRYLMGDFAWLDEQHDSDLTFTPFFFLTFVCIAVLVILNVLIAIVCDAYSDAKEMHEKAALPKVEFFTEVKELLVAVWRKPSRWNDTEWLQDAEGSSESVSKRVRSNSQMDLATSDDDDEPPLEGTSAAIVAIVDKLEENMEEDEKEQLAAYMRNRYHALGGSPVTSQHQPVQMQQLPPVASSETAIGRTNLEAQLDQVMAAPPAAAVEEETKEAAPSAAAASQAGLDAAAAAAAAIPDDKKFVPPAAAVEEETKEAAPSAATEE